MISSNHQAIKKPSLSKEEYGKEWAASVVLGFVQILEAFLDLGDEMSYSCSHLGEDADSLNQANFDALLNHKFKRYFDIKTTYHPSPIAAAKFTVTIKKSNPVAVEAKISEV